MFWKRLYDLNFEESRQLQVHSEDRVWSHQWGLRRPQGRRAWSFRHKDDKNQVDEQGTDRDDRQGGDHHQKHQPSSHRSAPRSTRHSQSLLPHLLVLRKRRPWKIPQRKLRLTSRSRKCQENHQLHCSSRKASPFVGNSSSGYQARQRSFKKRFHHQVSGFWLCERNQQLRDNDEYLLWHSYNDGTIDPQGETLWQKMWSMVFGSNSVSVDFRQATLSNW